MLWIAFFKIRNGSLRKAQKEAGALDEREDGEEELLPAGDALAAFEAMKANGYKVRIER